MIEIASSAFGRLAMTAKNLPNQNHPNNCPSHIHSATLRTGGAGANRKQHKTKNDLKIHLFSVCCQLAKKSILNLRKIAIRLH